MRAVDTNVLVRLLTRDDPEQAKRADAFVERGAWVSHVVLVETMWVLASVYALGARAIAKAAAMLLEHEHLVVQDAETVAAALGEFEARPSIGFSDCLIVQLAKKHGHVPVGTFDARLAKLEGAAKV